MPSLRTPHDIVYAEGAKMGTSLRLLSFLERYPCCKKLGWAGQTAHAEKLMESPPPKKL